MFGEFYVIQIRVRRIKLVFLCVFYGIFDGNERFGWATILKTVFYDGIRSKSAPTSEGSGKTLTDGSLEWIRCRAKQFYLVQRCNVFEYYLNWTVQTTTRIEYPIQLFENNLGCR